METLIDMTNNSNPLPMVKNGKCQGCNETATDKDVLLCCQCKNFFHVGNCTVRDSLGTDALPSKTNMSNYCKFSTTSYPTGNFTWTCFRCVCMKEVASKDNINQRVALLESLLLTISPAISSIVKSIDRPHSLAIDKLLSEVRSGVSNVTNDSGSKVSDVPAPTTSGNETDINPPEVPAPAIVEGNDPDNNTSSQLNPNDMSPQISTPVTETPEETFVQESPSESLPTDESAPAFKPTGTSFRIKIKSKSETGPPLRLAFHRALAAGKIGDYNFRFHSDHRADVTFDNFTDAETAYRCMSPVLTDQEVSTPICLDTKVIHIVGLTEDDSKDTVYKAICKPGRNRPIEHLINRQSFRVLGTNPCKKKAHVFRATVVVSAEIWQIILNKMNKKLKINYLSCSVFPRPDSIRCFRCQRLGHAVSTCTNEITCANCGGCHSSNGCELPAKCINCTELGFENNHRADSPNCTAYKNFQKGPAKNLY